MYRTKVQSILRSRFNAFMGVADIMATPTSLAPQRYCKRTNNDWGDGLIVAGSGAVGRRRAQLG